MTEGRAAIAALRAMIGRETEPIVHVIDEGSIKFFAESISDPNPLYHDQEYAKQTLYKGIIAPPTFLGGSTTLRNVKAGDDCVVSPISLPLAGPSRGVNGGDEFEFYVPIRPGDTLVSTAKLVDIVEKTGRSGPLLFLTTERTYTNQRGEVAVVRRSTTIWRAEAEIAGGHDE